MKALTLFLIGLVVGAMLSTVTIRRPFAMRRRDIQHRWTGPTLREVKRVASLITLNVPISDVQVSRLSGYVGSTSLVLLVRGDVELGTNLQAAEFTEVNLDAQRATLALPPPELSRPRLDLERTCVYRIDRDGLWKILPGHAGERELINQALQQAQRMLIEAAQQTALDGEARRLTEEILGSLFAACEWQVSIHWLDVGGISRQTDPPQVDPTRQDLSIRDSDKEEIP